MPGHQEAGNQRFSDADVAGITNHFMWSGAAPAYVSAEFLLQPMKSYQFLYDLNFSIEAKIPAPRLSAVHTASSSVISPIRTDTQQECGNRFSPRRHLV